MPRISKLAGLLYEGLFLGWVVWFCLPDSIRYPHLAGDILTRRAVPLLVCFLLSHWFVRRGEFWAAVCPLVIWGFLQIMGLSTLIVWDCFVL